MLTVHAPAQGIDNHLIVSLIQAGDARGEQMLYESYQRGLRFLAARHSPAHADDCVHDTMLAAVRQIKRGRLETPAALPGYLRTILKRTAWNINLEARRRSGDEETFESVVQIKADERADPHRRFEIEEQAQLLQEGLRRLKPVQRELLTRFYLQGEKPAAICRVMNLTETQFRLGKSRSKQLLQQTVAKALQAKPPATYAAAAAR